MNEKEKNIIASWEANADNWIDIIESNGIRSRVLATNKAVIDEVSSFDPTTVLDIGCGEGWLSAELASHGIDVTGIDVIPELVERAKKKSKGNFIVASYEDIATKNILFEKKFDAIVINFALIGKDSTDTLLSALPHYLDTGGKLVVQTLHPFSRKPLNDYESGWKNGSWDGLGDQFTQPYEWYFRTLEDWLDVFYISGFDKIYFTEPVHPETRAPLSILFVCSITGKPYIK